MVFPTKKTSPIPLSRKGRDQKLLQADRAMVRGLQSPHRRGDVRSATQAPAILRRGLGQKLPQVVWVRRRNPLARSGKGSGDSSGRWATPG